MAMMVIMAINVALDDHVGLVSFIGPDSHVDSNGHDNHSSPNGHSEFFAPGQAGKGLIRPKDLFGGRHQNINNFGDAFPYLWLCRYTIYKKACLEDLHGCRQPNGWNSSMRKICGSHLETWQSLCDLVWKAKNIHFFCQAQIALLYLEDVPITILIEYLDYSNICSSNSAAELPEPTGAPILSIYKKDGSFW